MTNPENEKLVRYLVVLDEPGRKFFTEADNRWGGLILPAPGENRPKTKDGLKVALFGSWEFGYLVLETLKEYDRRFPGKLNLVGLVTDHPLNPDSKISVRKRVWKFIDQPFRVFDETFIIESALCHGMKVYTGDIKVASFYRMIRRWNPDVILVCVFGQIINSFTINQPQYGIYNFHPSDLTKGQGAGPSPYDDLVVRNAETTVWSVHQVTENVDGGHVVGLSPPVNIRNSEGILPSDPLVVYQKLAEALTPLTIHLMDELTPRYGKRKQSPIKHIDFNNLVSEMVKARLMQPITNNTPAESLPTPDKSCFT